MTPKELAEKIVADKEYLERAGGFLTSKMPILAKAYLAQCKVVDAAKSIGCFKMGGSCCMNGFDRLKEALSELEKE